VVAVTRRGRRPWTQEVSVARGATVRLDAELEVTTQRRIARWTLVGSAALAVSGVVIGTLAVRAGHEAADLDEQRQASSITASQLAEYDRLVRQRNDYRTYSGALLGVAFAAGAAGALLLWFDTSEGGAPVTPMITGETIGVAITTDF
jgi:hypothetical protein